MKSALSLGALACATLLSWGARARAEQFIVTDVSYTHSADTTADSHYRVSPLAGAPKNWVSPVDFSTGSVHVLLEVKTKPTATPTKFQICFEGTPDYACTDQSPTYTTTGTYQWTTKFSDFYYGGDVDWSKGVSKVALILKDTMNMKPQGDPNYVPTDLRVEVAVISAGASYVAPMQDAGVAQDAGAKDAGGPRADAGEAGVARPIADAGNRDAGTDGGAAIPMGSDASITGSDSDSSAATNNVRDGATGGGPTMNGSDAGDKDGEDDHGSGGCSVRSETRGCSQAIWTALALSLAPVRRRRRRF